MVVTVEGQKTEEWGKMGNWVEELPHPTPAPTQAREFSQLQCKATSYFLLFSFSWHPFLLKI